MNSDDQYLEKLLKDIEIPTGLKSRLSKIPDLTDDDRPVMLAVSSQDQSRGRGWIALTLAASLLAVACYVLWPQLQPPTQIASDTSASKSNGGVVQPAQATTDNRKESQAQQILSEMAMELQSLNQVSAQLSINRLSMELRDLEHATRVDRRNDMSIDEQTALVLSLSEQTAIQLGVDPGPIEHSLTRIAEKYPGTRGAELATEILNNEL